ncbi:hypothetical protein BJF90_39795 [Pseudonocardia sp. CNS-004]|nr:hypothetical protein BJF90_39795 [Pseudonocardia sp. CNS-004]
MTRSGRDQDVPARRRREHLAPPLIVGGSGGHIATAVVEQRDGGTAHHRSVAAHHPVPNGLRGTGTDGRPRLVGVLHRDHRCAVRTLPGVGEPEGPQQGEVGSGLLGGPLVGRLTVAALRHGRVAPVVRDRVLLLRGIRRP